MIRFWVLYLFLFVDMAYCQSSQQRSYYPTGQVLESLKMSSKVMGKDIAYSVYLPPDYETSRRSYPVVYLLHGYTDDETAWVQFGEVNQTVDEGIANGTIPPMIIVMPDGGVTFFIDDYKGRAKFETMLLEELMPSVESQYRIRQKKDFRGISGLSMGGYGATILAMRHPDLFAACAAFSSAYRTDEEMANMGDRYDDVLGKLYGENLEGEARLTEHWHQYSPLYQAKTMDTEQLKSVRWYIDCGDEDFLYEGNSIMHIILRKRDIPHEYRVRDGTHNWSYWRTGIKEGLKFIGESFHR